VALEILLGYYKHVSNTTYNHLSKKNTTYNQIKKHKGLPKKSPTTNYKFKERHITKERAGVEGWGCMRPLHPHWIHPLTVTINSEYNNMP
jgi:hypothetical protein